MTELTQTALAGYHGAPNPHLYSSACFYAHQLGAYLAASGRTAPFDVRMSRGYSIRANNMLFQITDKPCKSGKVSVSFERVS